MQDEHRRRIVDQQLLGGVRTNWLLLWTPLSLGTQLAADFVVTGHEFAFCKLVEAGLDRAFSFLALIAGRHGARPQWNVILIKFVVLFHLERKSVICKARKSESNALDNIKQDSCVFSTCLMQTALLNLFEKPLKDSTTLYLFAWNKKFTSWANKLNQGLRVYCK